MLAGTTAPPLRHLSSTLLLTEKDAAPDRHTVDTEVDSAGTRLYVTSDGPAATVASLQRYIKRAEARLTCPLLHVLHAAPQAHYNRTQPLVYVEASPAAAAAAGAADTSTSAAVLTTCTEGCCSSGDTLADMYNAPVEAALCVFQGGSDAAAPSQESAAPFWVFLDGLVCHHARHFHSGAVEVELQGILVPTFEMHEDTAYNVDVFDDLVEMTADAPAGSGAAAARKSAVKARVDSLESTARVVAYLRRRWPRLVEEVGSSHLVLYVKWTFAASATAAPLTACLVWLQNDAVGLGRDGVYADAALEALLDELTLAAASATTPSEAAAVMQEDGICGFFEECCLTHTVKRVIRKHFTSVVLRRRPLFHWVHALPPHTHHVVAHRGAVTAVRFRGDAAVSRAVWSAAEMLVHWQQLADNAAARARAALQQRVALAGRSSRLIMSAPSRVGPSSLRAPRHRRAAQQRGLYINLGASGSTLERQRSKLNVARMYGMEDGQSADSSLSGTPRDSFLASSGLFRGLRSVLEDSPTNGSMLETEETFGSYPRLATRAVKRVSQVRPVDPTAR